MNEIDFLGEKVEFSHVGPTLDETRGKVYGIEFAWGEDPMRCSGILPCRESGLKRLTVKSLCAHAYLLGTIEIRLSPPGE